MVFYLIISWDFGSDPITDVCFFYGILYLFYASLKNHPVISQDISWRYCLFFSSMPMQPEMSHALIVRLILIVRQ